MIFKQDIIPSTATQHLHSGVDLQWEKYVNKHLIRFSEHQKGISKPENYKNNPQMCYYPSKQKTDPLLSAIFMKCQRSGGKNVFPLSFITVIKILFCIWYDLLPLYIMLSVQGKQHNLNISLEISNKVAHIHV